MSDTQGSVPKVGQEVWAAVSVIFCIAVILVFFFILCCAYRRHRRIRDITMLNFCAASANRMKANEVGMKENIFADDDRNGKINDGGGEKAAPWTAGTSIQTCHEPDLKCTVHNESRETTQSAGNGGLAELTAVQKRAESESHLIS